MSNNQKAIASGLSQGSGGNSCGCCNAICCANEISWRVTTDTSTAIECENYGVEFTEWAED